MTVWGVSIDPGIGVSNATGFALWAGVELQAAYVLKPSPHTDLASRIAGLRDEMSAQICRYFQDANIPSPVIAEVILEIPRVYPLGKGKGDSNDLIHIALAGGILSGQFPGAYLHFYEPRQWKGTHSKEVVQKICEKELSTAERARIRLLNKKIDHNVWEGIGLGLKRLGRFR